MVHLVIDIHQPAPRSGQNESGHSQKGNQGAEVETEARAFVFDFRQSMPNRGNGLGTAEPKSFLSSFKAELPEIGIFELVEDSKSKVFSNVGGHLDQI